jgi:hypothetical protein
MAGKIFFRERPHVGEGDRMPRFYVVAVAGADVKIRAKHVRKDELQQIADALGAELIELSVEGRGHKLDDDDDD